MSQIIPKTSLAFLEEKRIDRKKGNLFCIKSGNEHLVLMFVCSSDTISVVDENKKHDISMHQKLLFIFEKKHMRIFQLVLSVCSRGDFLFGIVQSFNQTENIDFIIHFFLLSIWLNRGIVGRNLYSALNVQARHWSLKSCKFHIFVKNSSLGLGCVLKQKLRQNRKYFQS